jgi:hypothetical protein
MHTPAAKKRSGENLIGSAVEDSLHRCRGKFPSSSGPFSPLVEAVSDSTESFHACAAYLFNRFQNFSGKFHLSPLNLFRGRLPRLGRIWGTKFDASCAGYRESSPSPISTQLALSLGKERNDADAELVGIRHIACDEINPTLLQGQQKGCVAGESIKFGDAKDGLLGLCQLDRCIQLGPAIIRAAFYLLEARKNLAIKARKIFLDSDLLRFEAVTAESLLLR